MNKGLDALDTMMCNMHPEEVGNFKEIFNTIKQELERLENLELNLDSEKYHLVNENQCLKNRVEDLEICYKQLGKENQELAEAIQLSNEYIAKVERTKVDLINENKKIKNVIKILKSNLCIEFNDNYNGVSFKLDKYDECDYTILCLNDKQQYNLLKDIFKNGK